MLERLADLLGNDATVSKDPQHAVHREPAALAKESGAPSPRAGLPRDTSLLLVSTRQMGRINSTRYVSPRFSRDQPCVHVSPDDAADRGLRDGDRAEIANDFGKVSANVRIDTHLRRGVISLPHGWAEANVCHLTSARHGLDPLTTQPQMTALPVSLTRLDLPEGSGLEISHRTSPDLEAAVTSSP